MRLHKVFSYSSVLCLGLVLLVSSCYKDKGNYTYQLPAAPVIRNMDSVYEVFVGDSLVIAPDVQLQGSTAGQLKYSWTIHVPPVTASDTDRHYEGKDLRIIFGLGPKSFTGRFAIENTANGMKYFKDFTLVGKTAFSKGMTVLSSEAEKTVLSFIKPDGTVQPYLFEAVNPGQSLPSAPTQILAIPEAYQPPVASYWIFGKSGENTGIQVDANDFKVIKTLKDNFFDAPKGSLLPNHMFVNPLGVISGIIGDRLYNGTTSTWNQAPTYGMFGQGAAGDYSLSPEMVFDYTGTFGPGNYIGFDQHKKQFVRFNLYGDATFFGPDYVVKGDSFDPKNVGMDLMHLQQIAGGLCFGYFIAPNDSIYECSMKTNFNGPFEFEALTRRPFARQELISPATLWAATSSQILFFSYKDKVYRYNPINEDFRLVKTAFGGKTVTMVKLQDANTLVVGTEGTLYFLDIRTGQDGTLIKKIEGLPGKIIDMAFREQ
ncbi:PKD-like family lipoprotein [Arachidicoccus terrestris]|uniref:PKD-like family lipoprotein n=1 Tax=Arachidicoccus terrestris TaxID=2875539 RepID=UPI001CC3AA05|nr:PKD-like family lipoprotein [Arachidicoccus terrestris]UAY56748.1 hypothetical protein K9M52_07085 [Arachidicoccus terrestris]